MERLLPYHVLMLWYVNSNIPINTQALPHQTKGDMLGWETGFITPLGLCCPISRLGMISGQWLTSSQGRHKHQAGSDRDQLKWSIYTVTVLSTSRCCLSSTKLLFVQNCQLGVVLPRSIGSRKSVFMNPRGITTLRPSNRWLESPLTRVNSIDM